MLDTLPKFLLFHVMSFLFSWEDPDPRLSLDTDFIFSHDRQAIPGRKCFWIAGISKYFHGIVHSQEYWHELMLFRNCKREAALYRSYCAFFCPTIFDPAISMRFCDKWKICQMTFISTIEPVIPADRASFFYLKNRGLDLLFQIEGKLYFCGHVRVIIHGQNRYQLQGFLQFKPETPDETRAMMVCKRLLCLPSCILLTNFWTGVVFVTNKLPEIVSDPDNFSLFNGQVLRATMFSDEMFDQLDQDHVNAKLLQ